MAFEPQARQESGSPQASLQARIVSFALPIALLVALAGALTLFDPDRIGSAAPPAEEIAFERVSFHETGIVAHVRNAANAPVTLAQVTVDDAFWDFTAEPDVELGPFEATTLTIPYPWVEGEPHVIGIVTNTGLVWSHEVAVAQLTPQPEPAAFADYALIGLIVGVLPVAAGMAFFPALRGASERWTNALLALTLGLLAFLAVDTVGEGLELADAMPGSYQALGAFFGAALLALVGVLALEGALKGRGRSAGATLALLIAVGIGLHNLGEGLLIGSAFALGSLALGTTLLVGFAVHNVTEGPAIVSPLAAGHGRLPWGRFVLLAAVAGLPTIAGAWLGAFASVSILPVLFFGLGAGAILVVLVQVGRAMRREGPIATPLNLVAFAIGYAIMLATSLLTA